MATFLHRLGGSAYRRRRVVLAAWLVVLVVAAFAAVTLKGSTNGTFSIPGTESQRAIDLLDQRMPGAGGASGRIVFAAPAGTKIDAAQKAAIERSLATIKQAPGVVSASDPFASGLLSKDGRVALTQVQWKQAAESLKSSQRDVVTRAAETTQKAGLRVEFGGDAAPATSGGGGIGEIVGILVAALVLAMTFRSLVAAGMPLLTAVIGVALGVLGITAASGFVDLSSAVPTLSIMLGLAVGIDYALFILSRHRTQLHQGMGVEESVALAVATAGSAVVFAGATVVIALVALLVVGIPFMGSMGLAAAGTVAMAVLIAITLVPALLGFAGMRVAKGKSFSRGAHAHTSTMGSRWVGLVTRHRWLAVVATVAVLGVVAIPALNMRLGLPDDSTAAPGTTQPGLRPAHQRVRRRLQRPADGSRRRGPGQERRRRRHGGAHGAGRRRGRRLAGQAHDQLRLATPRSSC